MNINEYLSSFFKGTKNPSLVAMNYFLYNLNHPEKDLKFVHIAGTNGKGSVAEMLSTVLERANYKVGEFMSPHIITFNERIRINHKNILDEELEELIKIIDPFVKKYNETHEEKVTLFEVETTMALLYFAHKKCDIVVLETGLGGLYDCTNVVSPLISIITSIGYDHMDLLGNTLEEIATQKAGIIKEKTDTVFIKQEQNVNEIIINTCKKKQSNLHLIDLKRDCKDQTFNGEYQHFKYKDENVTINLKGNKQIGNACIVLEAIKILQNKGYNISKESIEQGLKTVVHKARFEVISTNPTIIFDGGHNEAAIQNLKNTIKQHYLTSKKVYIVSILKTKDYKTVIKELMEDKDSIFIFTDGTKVQDEVRCYVKKEDLYIEASKYRKENIKMASLEDAINESKKKYKDAVIFIIGSFYTYSEVIEIINKGENH